MRRSGGTGRIATQTGIAVAVFGLLALPLVQLLLAAGSQGPGAVLTALARPGTLRAAVNTLSVSTAASLIAVSVALAAAQATARSQRSFTGTLRAAILLPLLVPPFAAAIGWTEAYGPGGILQIVLAHSLPGLLGPLGVILVTATEVTPIAYLVLSSAIRGNADLELTLAARACGSSAFGAFWRVTIRLLRPALGASVALCFVAAANNFAIPAVLGSPVGFETLTTRIYNQLNFSGDPNSFAGVQVLASALVVLTLVVTISSTRLRGDRDLLTTGRRSLSPRRFNWAPAGLLAVYVFATAVVPLAALVLTALDRAVGLVPTPANWSTVNFLAALSGGRFATSLGTSLVLATVCSSLVVALGLCLASVQRDRVGRVLANSMALGFAVPGPVLAIGYLLAYGQFMGGSILIILAAYVAKLAALGHRPLVGALQRLPSDLSLAARASGATASRALWTVNVPLLLPAVVAAWLLVFIFALHEVAISSLLYGPSTQTLAVLVLNVQQTGDVGTTAALATILTALLLAPAILMSIVIRRVRPSLRQVHIPW